MSAYKPRYYQTIAHDSAISWIKKSIEPAIIEAEGGSGKSHIIASIADTFHKLSGKHVLCTAPNVDLVEQNTSKFLLTGNKASVFSAAIGKSLRHPVVFGTPISILNSIEKFSDKFGLIVIDECFVGETLISCIEGIRRIDEIKIGDVLHNACGSGIVRNVTSKISKTITLELSNGRTIECTKDHPIFCEKGFVEAERLENGSRVFSREEVRMLWEIFSSEIYDIEKRVNCCKYIGISLDEANVLFSILCEEKEKSNEQCGKQRENENEINGNESQAANNGWEWSPTINISASTTLRSWRWMGNGIRLCYQSWTQKRSIPKLLQDRHSASKKDDSNRGGWKDAWNELYKVKRQEKTGILDRERMVSVSSIKPSGYRVVYNLHVSGHPSYFANGILVHNCHGITPSIKKIIDTIRLKNPMLRVLGLSATPYRFGTGLIYALDEHDKPSPERSCKDPYFTKKIFTIGGRELIEQGYLTPPNIGAIHCDKYETMDMQVNDMGKFNASDIDKAYHGQGRKTSIIISDIVKQSKYRQGVMIFAATVEHAKECMESLPSEISRMIGGDINMRKNERKKLVSDFKSKKFRYLVSIGTMTTGVDFTHVDVIALLRPTESVGLLRQIILRGARLHEGKKDFLVLDYCQAIERHCPDGDLFNPKITAWNAPGEGGEIPVICPHCRTENLFTPRPNPDRFGYSEDGYFVDLLGEKIKSEYGPMPSHFGRRCLGMQMLRGGKYERCGYYWTYKECPECGEKADIAARYCPNKHELIDPNTKLIGEYKAMRKDPYMKQTEKVLSWSKKKTLSSKGNECLQVNYITEYRDIAIWYQPKGDSQYLLNAYNKFTSYTSGGDVMPKSITYQKQSNGFYKIFGYNEQVPEIPMV